MRTDLSAHYAALEFDQQKLQYDKHISWQEVKNKFRSLEALYKHDQKKYPKILAAYTALQKEYEGNLRNPSPHHQSPLETATHRSHSEASQHSNKSLEGESLQTNAAKRHPSTSAIVQQEGDLSTFSPQQITNIRKLIDKNRLSDTDLDTIQTAQDFVRKFIFDDPIATDAICMGSMTITEILRNFTDHTIAEKNRNSFLLFILSNHETKGFPTSIPTEKVELLTALGIYNTQNRIDITRTSLLNCVQAYRSNPKQHNENQLFALCNRLHHRSSLVYSDYSQALQTIHDDWIAPIQTDIKDCTLSKNTIRAQQLQTVLTNTQTVIKTKVQEILSHTNLALSDASASSTRFELYTAVLQLRQNYMRKDSIAGHQNQIGALLKCIGCALISILTLKWAYRKFESVQCGFWYQTATERRMEARFACLQRKKIASEPEGLTHADELITCKS
jgi:hypothetical protein